MAWQEALEAALIALGMVTWPILGKSSQAPPEWVGVVVLSVTGVVAILLGLFQRGLSAQSFPSGTALGILIVAGILNGLATSRYAVRARMEGQTGTYLALVAILIVLEAPLVDMVLNRSTLSLRQCTGVACGVACVYLLGMK